MRYLLVMFLPPVYLAMRGKWLSCIISSLLLLASLPLWITVFGGLFCWLFAVAPAAWELHNEMTDIQATKIAKAIKKHSGS